MVLNPDLIALGVLVLVVLSVLIAWWYASRPRPYIRPTSFVVTSVSGLTLGSRLQIGSGANMEHVKVIGVRYDAQEVRIEPLVNTHVSGGPVELNRAQRRAKRWR